MPFSRLSGILTVKPNIPWVFWSWNILIDLIINSIMFSIIITSCALIECPVQTCWYSERET